MHCHGRDVVLACCVEYSADEVESPGVQGGYRGTGDVNERYEMGGPLGEVISAVGEESIVVDGGVPLGVGGQRRTKRRWDSGGHRYRS